MGIADISGARAPRAAGLPRGSRAERVRALEALGAVAVLRVDDAAQIRPVALALAAGEVRAVEITMTTPGALEALGALTAEVGSRGESLVLGAGSVLDPETARLAILAGARFVVGPTFCPAVLTMCHRYDVVSVPGAYTPTEILAAWEAGADLVKVFPAGQLGPSYVKDLRGPMPQLRLLPTGGVTAENAGAFLAEGAVAVGVGSALTPGDAVARGDYARITEEARKLSRAVREARQGGPRPGFEIAANPEKERPR
jgi:2-dehydro-3-deoxyphosphogluconate aldolase/(4S)-4-hydroxy-2-oxoglutarate aldolase